MPWVRIDDNFYSHPKVIAAGSDGVALFILALSWCGSALTDGFIPEVQVRRLSLDGNSAEVAQRLVNVGLWERKDGGYQIHDYLEYNPSAKQVKAKRKADTERQARWRDRQESNGVTNGVTNDVTNTIPIPDPIPDPIPEPEDIPPSAGADAPETSPESPPKTPKSSQKAKPSPLTPGAQEFLRLFSAKRFANAAQRDAVLELERLHSENFCACAKWAAELGVSRGKAIQMMRTALPDWGKKKKIKRGDGKSSSDEPAGFKGLRQWAAQQGLEVEGLT